MSGAGRFSRGFALTCIITICWEKSKTLYLFLPKSEREVLEDEHLLPHEETPFKWVKVIPLSPYGTHTEKDYAKSEKRGTISYYETCATKGYTERAIDLAVMRKRLEEKQAELQQHIAKLIGSPAQPEDSIQASDGDVEPEEEAVDLEETDVEQAILDNEKTLLFEVQQALARIENGTYGICSNCGQSIPEKRLEAIPWATLCVTCESKLESEG